MSDATDAQIAAWKEEYERVFLVDGGKQTYVFRSINFAEYEKALEISEKETSAEADDFLVQTALLHPEPTQENLDNMPALFASTLSNYILDFSCLGDSEHALKEMEEQRRKADDTKSVMMAFVLAAFPYKVEELESESFFSLARKVALAEQVLKLREAVSTGSVELQLEGPDSEGPQQPQPNKKPDKNQEVLQKLRADMDKAMSYVSTGPNVEFEG